VCRFMEEAQSIVSDTLAAPLTPALNPLSGVPSAERSKNQERPNTVSVELKELDNGKLLEVHLTGKLVKTDYETFLPAVERLVKQHGKLLMLVEFNDFPGWTRSALLGGHQVRRETLH
jgi:hypothetical protein